MPKELEDHTVMSISKTTVLQMILRHSVHSVHSADGNPREGAQEYNHHHHWLSLSLSLVQHWAAASMPLAGHVGLAIASLLPVEAAGG